MRLGLGRGVENIMVEGLIVFLTEGEEGASISVFPGDVGSQVASTSAYLMDTAI